MVRVDLAKWGQTLDDVRRTSLTATHPRTRERFQALYLIASGPFNATTCAVHLGRDDDTVLTWVHRYNARGPETLVYRRTGGPTPLLRRPKRRASSRPSKPPPPLTTPCPATCGR